MFSKIFQDTNWNRQYFKHQWDVPNNFIIIYSLLILYLKNKNSLTIKTCTAHTQKMKICEEKYILTYQFLSRKNAIFLCQSKNWSFMDQYGSIFFWAGANSKKLIQDRSIFALGWKKRHFPESKISICVSPPIFFYFLSANTTAYLKSLYFINVICLKKFTILMFKHILANSSTSTTIVFTKRMIRILQMWKDKIKNWHEALQPQIFKQFTQLYLHLLGAPATIQKYAE